jgi:uncharacterized protein
MEHHLHTDDVAGSVAVLTGGHSFHATPFFAMFDDVVPGQWRHVGSDNAISFFAADTPGDGAAVVVFYDMPGIAFTRSSDPTITPVVFTEPPVEVIDGFARLMDAGIGMVFLHHAVAGWPTWDGYAEIIGARFHYQPAVLRGVSFPDSGYVHDVTHTVSVVDSLHPVCEGLRDSFEITDELYCYPVFTDSVLPLLRTSFPVADATQFFSADAAIRGRRDCRDDWTHPPGSDLVGWVKRAGRSPVVYLQFGDGPTTYANVAFRRLLGNAVRWAANP